MNWFRLYHSMLDSERVGRLSSDAFRTWIELMCLASRVRNAGDTGATADGLDWQLRRRNVTETLQELIEAELVTRNKDGTLAVTGWDSRQVDSDSSTQRVQKHRKNKAQTKGNVTETLQERMERVQEESRVEENKPKPPVDQGGRLRKVRGVIHAEPESFRYFWEKAWPKSKRKVDRAKCCEKWKRISATHPLVEGEHAIEWKIINHVRRMAKTAQWRDGYEPAPMTYLNGERWQDPVPEDENQGGLSV